MNSQEIEQKNNRRDSMEWSLDAIASSLRLEFEEGYNDRYTFTLTANKLSVDDLHLGVNVCTIEPDGEGYILHPHEETVDAIVLNGTSENPWLLANHFVDLYDTEHPVPQDKYIAYLEHKVEQLESSLAEKQGELVAMDILKTNKDTEIAAMKEENARLVSELNEQGALIKEMKDAAKHLGYTWQDYDAGEDCWEDTHTGKWVKAEKNK